MEITNYFYWITKIKGTTMNKKIPLILIALIPTTSIAAEDSFSPHWYAGLHVGNADSKLSASQFGFSEKSSFLNIGGNVGYRFSENFSVELLGNFSTESNDKSEVTVITDENGFVSYLEAGKLEAMADTIGLYAVGQSSGELYVKGRIGYADIRVSHGFSGTNNVSDTGLSYGLGGGYRISPSFRVELEYIVLPEVSNALLDTFDYDQNLTLLSVISEF